jgi:hypothetical protein
MTGALLEVSILNLIGTLILQILFGGFALLVFLGLVSPRPWARWASVVFAICIFVLYVLAMYRATPMMLTPSERVGAGIAEIVMAFALALYPTRLYFSKAVRAFFGVGQRAGAQ